LTNESMVILLGAANGDIAADDFNNVLI